MATNVLYVVLTAFTYMGEHVAKGATLALTAAQVTAIGASKLRAVNSSVNTNGSQTSSPTHDTLGEHAGVSNSS